LATDVALLLLQTMAGIYLHIPFCRKACHYCNFHFSTSLHRKPELLQALEKEIQDGRQRNALAGETLIETIYFGGGTPSILDPAEIQHLMDTIRQYHNIYGNAEITLEANPDDITPHQLARWKDAGINRLSIGIQSFRQQDLTWMNRAHNAAQATQCIKDAVAEGITNISIDLIFGTPGLSDDDWKRNLDLALETGVQHISAYALTVEEKTALHYFIKKGKTPPPGEEGQAHQFEILMDTIDAAGWEHYEISNCCKPGHRSRHNSSYWQGKPYLGYGPSAHGYDGNSTRWMGIANNAMYIDAWLHQTEPPYEIEQLSSKNRINEKIMTGLRRMEGFTANEVTKSIEGIVLEVESRETFFKTLELLVKNGICNFSNDRVTLTRKGKLQADAVAVSFFM
jgi:oxygen-independent coproporphyrinogen III oxidase